MRYQKIDILRGIALIGMIVFHFWYTLRYLFLFDLPGSIEYWNLLGRTTGLLFITLAGVSFALAEKKYPQSMEKKYIPYALRILFYALLVSFGSFILFPQMYIQFGILHFFSISFLLLLLCRFLRYYNIYLVLLVFFFSLFIGRDSENSLWFILGFISPNFNSLDFYPLFPHFGYILAGYLIGLTLIERNYIRYFSLKKESFLARILILLGKNSLNIYMLHIPFLFILPFLYILVKNSLN